MRIVILFFVVGACTLLILQSSTQPPHSDRDALASLQRNPVGAYALQTAERAIAEATGEMPDASFVFAPGTPDAYVAARMARWQSTGRYIVNNRWGSDFGRKGVALTYSFPDDGVDITGYGFSNMAAETDPNERVNHMNARWSALFGNDVWKQFFRDAYADIELLTGVTFTEVTDDNAQWPNNPGPLDGGANRGDIRIVSARDDGIAGTLAFNYYPNSGGDMLLDSADAVLSWFGDSTNNYRLLRNVILHETGHGLGVRHSCPQNSTKIMEPLINENFDGMQIDDIHGVQHWYGDRFEFGATNDSIFSAVPMAESGFAFDGMSHSVQNLSINSTSDIDAFRIDVPAGDPVDAQITVAPRSQSYLAGAQNGDGSCSAGSPFSSVNQADLQFTLQTFNGAVSTTVNDHPAGTNETFQMSLMPNETYIISVRNVPAGAYSGVQLYTLLVRLTPAMNPADLSGDGCIDGTDLAFLLAQWSTTGPAIAADLNGDMVVDGMDLAGLLAAWAPCF